MDNFKKYITEFIGAFFLVFTVGATALFGGDGVIAPIAIGFVLMVMVYAGGHISGGHYNPAVSLAAVVKGALPAKDFVSYAIAQIIGAVLAGGLVLLLVQPQQPVPGEFDILPLVVGEALFTFALCYVVLLVAASKATEGNSFYGLAIGSVVTVGAFAVGGTLCFGAFNPAVAIGLGVMGIAGIQLLLITLVVNLIAGAFAGIVAKKLDM